MSLVVGHEGDLRRRSERVCSAQVVQPSACSASQPLRGHVRSILQRRTSRESVLAQQSLQLPQALGLLCNHGLIILNDAGLGVSASRHANPLSRAKYLHVRDRLCPAMARGQLLMGDKPPRRSRGGAAPASPRRSRRASATRPSPRCGAGGLPGDRQPRHSLRGRGSSEISSSTSPSRC
jgi:hypothetical protein